jgi:hypothetical protein
LSIPQEGKVNAADRNNEEIPAATRERIDEFNRELALALKRIVENSKADEDNLTPETLKATPISKDEEANTL